MSPEQMIEEAVGRYQRPLISYAKEITGDLESARDAVQETFLRLTRQDLPTLWPRLAPWLFFVCRNCALDHCRKVVRFADGVPEGDQPDAGPGPLGDAMASEEGARLRELITQLPLQQRELVKLKFEADLSYKEMSEILRISVSHVGVQLHEAIKTLRRHWNTQGMPTP